MTNAPRPRPAAPPFETDGRRHPHPLESAIRAIEERDRGPDSDPWPFDFGDACELERERREPLVELIPEDDETLGDALDLDAALGCFTLLGDEPPRLGAAS